MNHDYYIERLSGYHDRNLPLDEMELLSRHLDDCDECRAALAEYEKLDRLVEEQSGLGGSSEYWENLANKIERKIGSTPEEKIVDISSSSYRGLGWKLTAVAASFAVIGFIALYQDDILNTALDEVKEPVGKSEAVERVAEKPSVETGGASRAALRDSVRRSHAERLSELKIKAPEKVLFKPSGQVIADAKEELIAVDKRRLVKGDRIRRIEIAESEGKNFELQSLKKKEIPAKPLPVMDEEMLTEAASVGRGGRIQLNSISQSIDVIAVEQRSLSDWQSLRDSVRAGSVIVQALDELSEQPGKKSVKKSSAKKYEAFLESNFDTIESQPPADSLFLLAYFNVGLLTTDSTERNRSIKFFENYLKQDNPHLKKQARSYLENLRKADFR